MTVPLLMTKLYLPLPGKYLVERVRLVEKLDQCLEPGHRLALVSAPAGFGKTTLVAAWATGAKAKTPGLMVAWLSIDEGDNDPVIFWSYVIAALQMQQPEVGQKALGMLGMPGAELEGKLALLINDLHQINQTCVLVLDDYHLVRSPVIHKSLGFVIEHLPPHVHLVIASRTDPPLPLALMRGRGQLLEVRLHDLRFSNEDADSYLNSGVGLHLGPQSVEQLNHKTEGWIAGLQMAALAMQDLTQRDAPAPQKQEKAASFVASFSGSNRYILDYLIEEVLNRQPEPIQQFLIMTSVLDRLCGPLCDALLQGEGPEAQLILEQLESANLFLFPLDDQRRWYRYHQLFADLLRKRLAQGARELAQSAAVLELGQSELAQSAAELIRELHRRAMAWYEQNGMIPQAVHHALQMPDFQKAAALVAQIAEELWGRGEHATLLAWIDALPEAEKQRYPHLLTFQVSMLISAGKLQEAEACIPILERYIQSALEANPNQADLIGKVSELRTYIASFYGDRQGVFTHAQTALANLTSDAYAGKRCGICSVLGHAFLLEGQLEEAGQAYVEAIAAGKKARRPHMTMPPIANLSMVLWLQGRLSRAAQVAQEGLQLIQQYSLERSPTAADLSLTWASLLVERGNLAEAAVFVRQGVALAQEQQYIWQMAWGYMAEARLLLAQGDLPGAETAAQAAEQWAQAHDVPAHIANEAAGLLARVWLRQGKTTPAAQLLQGRGLAAAGEISMLRQSEYLALARLLWMQGESAGAVKLLDRIAHWAEGHHQPRALAAALILQALISQRSGKIQAGLPFLQHALALAEPEGYVQLFVEEGQPLAALLGEAARQGESATYASRLLAAFPDGETGPAAEAEAASDAPAAVQPARTTPAAGVAPLAEPLSPREMETLQLIAEGYSNKEIAQKMCVSLRTVKYYSTGLYNKLGVDSRMQAVNRARELGLIEMYCLATSEPNSTLFFLCPKVRTRVHPLCAIVMLQNHHGG